MREKYYSLYQPNTTLSSHSAQSSEVNGVQFLPRSPSFGMLSPQPLAAGSRRRGNRSPSYPPYSPQVPQGYVHPTAPRLPPPSPRGPAPRHSVKDRVPRGSCRCRCSALPSSRRRCWRAWRDGAHWGGSVAGVPGVGGVGLRARSVEAAGLPLGRAHRADARPLLHNARLAPSFPSVVPFPR